MSLISEIPNVVPGEINMRSFSEKVGCAGALIGLVVAPLGSLHAGVVPAAYPERPIRYVLRRAPQAAGPMSQHASSWPSSRQTGKAGRRG